MRKAVVALPTSSTTRAGVPRAAGNARKASSISGRLPEVWSSSTSG